MSCYIKCLQDTAITIPSNVDINGMTSKNEHNENLTNYNATNFKY